MQENLFTEWYSRKELQEFLGYGQTKMSQISKDYDIRVVKIGRRVFYNAKDVENLFSNPKSQTKSN